MNRNWLIGVIVIIVVIALAFAFIGFGQTSGAFILNQNDPLLIGASLSLSGKAASYGVQLREGMEFAIEEIKNRGKELKVKVLFDDTQSAPEKAVTSVQKFIQIDGAKVIITVGADETLAVLPVTEDNNVILFTPIAGSDKVDELGEYVFRNREASKLTAYSIAEFLINKKINSVALFVAKASSSPLSYEKAFMEKYSSLGGKVDLEFYYDEANPDIRTDIVKIKETDINAIYIVASKDKDGGEIVKQLKEMGYSGLIVGGPALDTETFFNITQDSSEGLIISISTIDTTSPNVEELLNKFKEKYGKEMSPWSANAFDMVNLLNDAAIKCGDNTNCIKDYLYLVKDYLGIGGKTTFNSLGGVEKPMTLKVAKNKKFVLYEAN